LDYRNVRVCLVDNGSTPPLDATLAKEYPEITTVRLPVNAGYAAACNAGLRWAQDAGVDYVLLLNDDTEVEASLVSTFLARADRLPKPAIVAPKILNALDRERIWSAGGVLGWPWLDSHNIGCGEADRGYDESREVSWATGCALFFHRDVISKVGFWDERYFLYQDDVEWCMRARRSGVAVYFEPRARLFHEVSATNQHLDERIIRYYAHRNRYLLAFAHTGVVRKLLFGLHLAFTLGKAGARSLFSPAYRRDALYHARTRALIDVLLRRYGKAPYPDSIDLSDNEPLIREATA
jgi:GT2 family glycosyltransferase